MSQPMRKTTPTKIIPAANVRIMAPPLEDVTAEQAPPPPLPAEPAACGQTPEVILLKDGNRVKTIVIKCGCGQVTCLDCEY